MSMSNRTVRRRLSTGEQFVLDQIRDMYGTQNDEQAVLFSDKDEAVIFVRDKQGVQGLCAVLTTLGAMYSDGTIASVDELRSNWLTPPV
jgi:hypothetical protein